MLLILIDFSTLTFQSISTSQATNEDFSSIITRESSLKNPMMNLRDLK